MSRSYDTISISDFTGDSLNILLGLVALLGTALKLLTIGPALLFGLYLGFDSFMILVALGALEVVLLNVCVGSSFAGLPSG